MASVTLTAVWVNLASDESQSVQLDAHAPGGFDEDFDQAGAVRIYAGGRRRLIAGEGQTRRLSLTAVRLSRANLATLRGWQGDTLLMVRDQFARKFWCRLEKLNVKEEAVVSTASTAWTVSVSFAEVDHDEEV